MIAEIRAQIAELPAYGYRRARALVNGQPTPEGTAQVNPKRAYRVVAQAGLLLPMAPRRRQSSRPQTAWWACGAATCVGAPVASNRDDHICQGLLRP